MQSEKRKGMGRVSEEKKTKQNEGKKILIVDDEPESVEELRQNLENSGHRVIFAYDGREGLIKVQEENPDLVILDLMLPGMNGYKICRLLKYDERYRHIPIIMFSARADENGKELAKEVGIDAWLTKPFKREMVFQVIEKLLLHGRK
ncbi:MAG: response regulator transcription factor [Candidatus Omnitrophota bacterium]